MTKLRPTPKIRVEVTQDFIDHAITRDSSHCMISQAVLAAYPEAKNISTDLQTIRLSDYHFGHRYIYLTPRIAQICLIKWDRGEKIEPFSFILRAGQSTYAGAPRKRHEAAVRDGFVRTKPTITDTSKATATRTAKLYITEKERNGNVPAILGGRAPPQIVSKLGKPSKRRAYGLRALEM